MSGRYDELLLLPHHVSGAHPPLSRAARAAQFSPFAALTGFEEVLRETVRRTDRQIGLGESEQAELNEKLRFLCTLLPERPAVTLTRFVPDARKEGGASVTLSGRLRRIDPVARLLVLADGTCCPFDQLCALECDRFPGAFS